MVKLSVVVVTWNAGKALARCLATIPSATGSMTYEILLVDNASSDGSVEQIRDRHPAVQILSPGKNLGFGKGVDLAVRQARGTFLAIVNPDLVLYPDSLANLATVLEDQPNVGLIGPRVCLPDGTVQTGAERFPGFLSALAYVPLFGRLYWRAWARRRHTEGPTSCDWVRGALMVIRSEALRTAGGFPTATFMYGEEILLGHALQKVGWQVQYVPKTLAVHYSGFSTRQRWTSDERIIVQNIAQVQFMRTLLSLPSFVLWNLVVLAGLLLQQVAKFFGWHRSRTKELVWQLVKLRVRVLFKPTSKFPLPKGRLS